MRYVVICKDQTAFATDWFEKENCWNPDTIHSVVDNDTDRITFDGESWHDIENDHL